MIRTTRWNLYALLLALPLLAAGGACQRAGEEQAAPPRESEPAAEAAAPAEQPAAVAPLPSHEVAAAAPADSPAEAEPADEGAGTDLEFDLPQGWQSQTPGSSMRLAQATIPGPGGPADFAVFFFGPGQGGTVDANLHRWAEQMGADPGKRDSFETHGLTVSWIDVAGTLQPMPMGMGPTTPQPNSRLLGAVVEGPGGPWFFKATGPDKTLGPQRDAFLQMLKSVRPRPAGER